jgi:hypothetical protein
LALFFILCVAVNNNTRAGDSRFDLGSDCFEQAAVWTLSDVLKSMTPEKRREEGLTKMQAFCKAFNESFHLVGFLYECNANPFVTSDGRVDLSGGKRGGDDVSMNENSTLNFSLPSSSHGETDATGLCTIRLLTTLQVISFTIVLHL